MRIARSWFLAAVVLASVDCGGDATGGGGGTLVIVSGNGQSGHIGEALLLPLIVQVTGGGGSGVPGTPVTWAVTSGVATVSPTSGASDASGQSATNVTLGATAGAVTVKANASGYGDATFTLTAVGPAALTIAAGDSQAGPAGGPLPAALAVNLLGTDALPYAGAAVAWSVSGGGTASPGVSITDATGRAATSVTLGPTLGVVTVTAIVAGVTPASFAAVAIDPCQYVAPHTVGTTVSGALAASDCQVSIGGATYYYDFYGVTAPGLLSVTVGMSSAAFDTWVDFFTFSGRYVAFNDDSATGNTNSHIALILGTGDYVIGANSFDPLSTGPYTLRTAARSMTIAGCRLIFTTRAVMVSETVASTDCIDTSTGSTYYSDRLAVFLEAGDAIAIRMQSTAVDPHLYIFDVTLGMIVAINDDSATGNPTAFVQHVAGSTGFYILDFGTSTAGETGAYTMDIAGPVGTLAAARSGRVVVPPASGAVPRRTKEGAPALRGATRSRGTVAP